jgi:hypothetical protein
MNPERSETLARALAVESDGLPEDFAASVAALAQASGAARHSSWNEVALFGAFATMVGVCVAGWFAFGSREQSDVDWMAPIVTTMTSQPWLVIGLAGVAIVQAMTFRRRARI